MLMPALDCRHRKRAKLAPVTHDAVFRGCLENGIEIVMLDQALAARTENQCAICRLLYESGFGRADGAQYLSEKVG